MPDNGLHTSVYKKNEVRVFWRLNLCTYFDRVCIWERIIELILMQHLLGVFQFCAHALSDGLSCVTGKHYAILWHPEKQLDRHWLQVLHLIDDEKVCQLVTICSKVAAIKAKHVTHNVKEVKSSRVLLPELVLHVNVVNSVHLLLWKAALAHLEIALLI